MWIETTLDECGLVSGYSRNHTTSINVDKQYFSRSHDCKCSLHCLCSFLLGVLNFCWRKFRGIENGWGGVWFSSTICRGPTEFSKTLPDWGFTPLHTINSSHQHCRVEIAAHQSHVWNILQNELTTWGQVGFSTCGVSIVWFISLHLTLLYGSREVESKKNGNPADLNPRASARREWILNLRFFYLRVEAGAFQICMSCQVFSAWMIFTF